MFWVFWAFWDFVFRRKYNQRPFYGRPKEDVHKDMHWKQRGECRRIKEAFAKGQAGMERFAHRSSGVVGTVGEERWRWRFDVRQCLRLCGRSWHCCLALSMGDPVVRLGEILV